MANYSPQSPLEFLSEKEESEEEVDTVTDDQQPQSEEIEEQEEVETADHFHSIFSLCVEVQSSERKSIMDTDSASGSSSSSYDNQLVEENATSSDSTIAQEPPFRSVFALKPRDLKMKGVSFTPELPAKRSFDNAVEEDDCQIQKTNREEGKAQNENCDDEGIIKGSNKLLLERLGRDEGILDYYSKNGEYPIANSSAKTDFVKNSLQEASEGKVLEVKNAGNLIEFDEDKRDSKAGEEEDDLSMYPFLKESLQFVTMNLNDLAPVIVEGIGLIGDSKVKDLNEKWRKLKVEEIELFVKRLDLILEQTKLVLKAIESSSLH